MPHLPRPPTSIGLYNDAADVPHLLADFRNLFRDRHRADQFTGCGQGLQPEFARLDLLDPEVSDLELSRDS